MDDTLEIPRPRTDDVQDEDGHSGDEDAGLDWTKLPTIVAAARPVIPKRGEKDFEPAPGGGSGLQLHVLDRSRNAMFEALRANRATSSKTISYGIWHSSINRLQVITARGIHFSTMGHSVSRMTQHGNASSKLPKQLELFPEEALYLIERGALFCYKSISDGVPPGDPSDHETQGLGAPMSVQQAFAEMIGREEMTLERYQVYAYLKRLGFILIRAELPISGYPVAPPVSPPAVHLQTLTRWFTGLFSRIVSNVISVASLFCRIDWWKRLQLHQRKTIQGVFRGLRFIPCGHTVSLYRPPVEPGVSSESSPPSSPYKIFFHVYKPSTPFRKTSPPAPDFHLVVVDARTTTMPSLQELTALFTTLPEVPLPPARKRSMLASAKQQGDPRPQEGSTASMAPPKSKPSRSSALFVFFQRLFFFLPCFCMVPPAQTSTPLKPNPFLALKTGKKIVVIAAVDAGNISFFRFGQGAFEEWPMI